MQDFSTQDPSNKRIPDFIKFLEKMEDKSRRIAVLDSTIRGATNDVSLIFELAECYLETQNGNGFFNTINAILSTSNMPPQIYFRLATLCQKGNRYPEMIRALEMSQAGGGVIFSNAPPEVYVDYARMYAMVGKYDKTAWALEEFVKKVPGDWRAWLDLASVHMVLGNTNSAVRDITQALTFGGNDALTSINQDQRFAPIRDKIKDSGKIQIQP